MIMLLVLLLAACGGGEAVGEMVLTKTQPKRWYRTVITLFCIMIRV
jgi:hypothetical protein